MASTRELFWQNQSFAVIGNSARMPFARLTYQGIKVQHKQVFAIDVAGQPVEGDPSFTTFSSLPSPVEAAILELPNDETATWVKNAIEAGVKKIWIHQQTDTPEALEIARLAKVELHFGTCAVMYLMPKQFPHSFHGWLMRIFGKY